MDKASKINAMTVFDCFKQDGQSMTTTPVEGELFDAIFITAG